MREVVKVKVRVHDRETYLSEQATMNEWWPRFFVLSLWVSAANYGYSSYQAGLVINSTLHSLQGKPGNDTNQKTSEFILNCTLIGLNYIAFLCNVSCLRVPAHTGQRLLVPLMKAVCCVIAIAASILSITVLVVTGINPTSYVSLAGYSYSFAEGFLSLNELLRDNENNRMARLNDDVSFSYAVWVTVLVTFLGGFVLQTLALIFELPVAVINSFKIVITGHWDRGDFMAWFFDSTVETSHRPDFNPNTPAAAVLIQLIAALCELKTKSNDKALRELLVTRELRWYDVFHYDAFHRNERLEMAVQQSSGQEGTHNEAWYLNGA
jgi:hypothetical protein